ncbi:MAG: hypothetical protein WAV30_04785 [Microgenomates group bacterium]
MHRGSILSKFSIIFALVSLSVYAAALVSPVFAINMNSDEYRIQFGTVNSGGKKMTDSSYKLSTSVGQAAAKEFQSNGYIVKAGFQYIYSRIPFTFSLSTVRVDLGTLIPNTPSTGTVGLEVSFGGAGQYLVTARADSPLSTNAYTSTIPFTSCDGGINTCTITVAKPWTSTSLYGFGYNMTGEDIPTDFIDGTYYRPFSNLVTPETPAVVMQSTNVTADISPTPNPAFTPAPVLTGVPRDTVHQSTMTMKVNISSIQPAGTYATIVRFLATPSF